MPQRWLLLGTGARKVQWGPAGSGSSFSLPQSDESKKALKILACLAVATFSTPLFAAAPVVRLVPVGPFRPDVAPEARFDGPLPASEQFDLEVPPMNGVFDVVGGTLAIWPDEEWRCEQGYPGNARGVRQLQERAMSLQSSADQRVLRASVAPLQIGQKFCFLLSVRLRPSEVRMRGVFTDVARKTIVAHKEAPLRMCSMERAVRDGLAGELQSRAELAVFAAADLTDVAANVTIDDAKCVEYSVAHAQLRNKIDAREASDDERNSLRKTVFQQLAGLASGNVYVWLNDREPKPVTAGLERADPVALANVAVQLNAWSAAPWIDNLEPELSNLHGALETVRNAAGADLVKARGELRNALSAFARKAASNPSRRVALWDGSALRSPSSLVVEGDPSPAAFDGIKALEARLESLLAVLRSSESAHNAGIQFDQLSRELSKLVELEDPVAFAGVREQERKAAEDLGQRYDALLLSFRDGLIAASQHLIANAKPLVARPTAGAGRTPDKGNFAAVDLGTAVAYPLTERTGESWVVPYIGLNLYFMPVDRQIDVTELVGNPVLQRFSFTVGVALSNPELSGREVEPVVLDSYGIVAAGYRLTNYIRITAGGVFYKVRDKNPAIDKTKLGVAPSAGLSLDVDVIHMLGSAMKK